MKIGIDARMMGKDVRGIGRYVERLLSHLTALEDGNEYTVFIRAEAVDLVPAKMKAVITNIRWYTFAEQFKLGKIFDAEKLDLIHVPHWNAPLRLKTPLALTIHDMILWEHPSLASTTLSPLAYWAKYFFYRLVVSQNIKRAKIVFTVSESAKNSILRNIDVSPEKILVTPNGVEPFAEAKPWIRGESLPSSASRGFASAAEAKPRLPYILSVGSGYPHKNMETFFKVAKELTTQNPQLTAIVVGTDPAFADKLKEQARSILGDNAYRVNFAGLVTDAELGALYRNANALFFTSQAEGFGFPALEAALSGCPVIASNIDTSRETLKNSVPLIEPTDVSGYAAAYKKIMTDPAFKTAILAGARAQVEKFKWEKTAALTRDGYKRTFSTT